jgi:hypothetical protein
VITRTLLALLLVTAGCDEPAPRYKPHAPIVMPSASGGPTRRVDLGAGPAERPSELVSVTDDHPDPEAQRLFQARMGQAAVPLVPAPLPQRVTATRLDDTRRGEAPDMKPASDIYGATLAEGQRATMKISLAPTDCVTFIAQGGIGVIEVDLFLTSNDTATGRVLAEDTSVGPIAVIGGHGKCVSGAKGTGTDAVLNVAVRRGAGLVLVQTYKRG